VKPTLLIAILMLTPVVCFGQRTLGDGIKELATQINTSATKQKKQKIAVLPFHELDGQPTVLGAYLAEELVTDLFQLGNFEIVERQLLDKVMGELKMEQSGAIDPKTAKEIGRVTGVDAIVTGSITDLQSFVGINCRLIDSSTGKIFGAAQTKITKDDDVRKIMGTKISTPSVGGRQGPPSKAGEGSEEENVGVGTYEGTITVCKFGVAPENRGWPLMMAHPPLCIKSEGKILQLPLSQTSLQSPPFYYGGTVLNIWDLRIGDLVEARVVREQSGDAALQDMQILKRAPR
jgi:curli biogenesis system outer membrane secretion channel CsgG